MSEEWRDDFEKYVSPVGDGSSSPVVPLLLGFRGEEAGEKEGEYRKAIRRLEEHWPLVCRQEG
jgi:hypothetical protein